MKLNISYTPWVTLLFFFISFSHTFAQTGNVGANFVTSEMLIDRTEIKKQSFYQNLGWDFTDIWIMEDGKDYPVLRKDHTGTSIEDLADNNLLNCDIFTRENSLLLIPHQKMDVTVYNLKGEMLFGKGNVQDQIILDLNEGVYILKLENDKQKAQAKVLVK